MEKQTLKPKARESSLELFRIITMLVIVAHHYVVNSGISSQMITAANATDLNSLFCLLFGWGGKTGINCFLLITGYFMCRSNITLKKFLKLFLSISFYNVVIYFVFFIGGYSDFSAKELLLRIIPLNGIGESFFSTFLVFYLFIPFLNILIKGMNERQHLSLIGICLLFFSVVQTLLKVANGVRYIGWFMVLYFIASYFRIYPKPIFSKTSVWGIATVISLLLSWGSVVVGAYTFKNTGTPMQYFYVSDSNKILALVTAVSAFLFFKNLKMKYIPVINVVASSAFGVLMIHANSNNMRKWLWSDTLKNTQMFSSDKLIVHAVVSVLGVYVVCTVIDLLRIYLLEKPFFKLYDKWDVENKIKRIFISSKTETNQ
ncbi:MAG: acyltransferase [Ruminococcaceae bacterium]|nr:acyltransferase [Oscillospiraceae bacterium]